MERTISKSSSNYSIAYKTYVSEFIGEPFELYVGSYTLAKVDQTKLAKERIIRFYEARLIEQNQNIKKLQDEME